VSIPTTAAPSIIEGADMASAPIGWVEPMAQVAADRANGRPRSGGAARRPSAGVPPARF
jgi:hypothetical protein